MLIRSGKIRHGGHPVLRWNASNAVAETDPAGNIKPTKDPKKVTGRIDGIVASVMAIGRAMAGAPSNASIYSTRGILTI
jgi:phage terminase large subunit-like protein